MNHLIQANVVQREMIRDLVRRIDVSDLRDADDHRESQTQAHILDKPEAVNEDIDEVGLELSVLESKLHGFTTSPGI